MRQLTAKTKKYLKWGGAALILWMVWLGVSILFLPPVSGLKERNATMTIRVKDWKGNYHPFKLGPKNPYWTPSASLPAEMKWAVILAEDKNFYKHEGFDVKAIKSAIKYDLEKKSLARGASTITQQVAKNIFLSREKSINRKMKEVYLAWRMEDELTKGRIIELYLNVVELGPMVYGIGHGSRYYFGKHPSQLTPRECAFLAAMLPGPRVAYNPYKNLNKVIRRSEMILKLLRQRGAISEEEYRVALAEPIGIGRLQRKVDDSIRKEEAMPNRTSAVAPEGLPAGEGTATEPAAPAAEGESAPAAEAGQAGGDAAAPPASGQERP